MIRNGVEFKHRHRHGLEYIAVLAAEDWKRDKAQNNLKEFAHNYLMAYTKGVITDGKTYKLFCKLIENELRK